MHLRGGRVVAEQRPRERRDVVLGEAAQPDPQQDAVALELGERAGQRAVAAELGVAVGPEHEQRRPAVRAQQEARQQQRAAVGPVQVVDDQQQAALAGERRVDGVEQAVAGAGRVLAGPRTSAAPAGRSASANGSNAASGSSEQRPAQHARARLEDLAREAMGQARLADAGLPGDQHDPRGRGRWTSAQAARRRSSSVARPTNAVSCSRRSTAGGGDRSGRAPQRVEQRAGLARRRDRERRAQPLGEALAGDQRRRPVARLRQPLDQAPVGVLRERVERHLLAGQAHRLGGVVRCRGQALERVGEPLGVRSARVVGPVVVEAVEDRRAARVERGGGVAAAQRRVEPARVDVGAVERDRVAGGDDVLGGGAERAPQFAQGGTQARAGGLVEDVRPEPRGELRAAVRAWVEREVGEDAARAP